MKYRLHRAATNVVALGHACPVARAERTSGRKAVLKEKSDG
jgi:hypothetical protein